MHIDMVSRFRQYRACLHALASPCILILVVLSQALRKFLMQLMNFHCNRPRKSAGISLCTTPTVWDCERERKMRENKHNCHCCHCSCFRREFFQMCWKKKTIRLWQNILFLKAFPLFDQLKLFIDSNKRLLYSRRHVTL